jgi:hypothetical protein
VPTTGFGVGKDNRVSSTVRRSYSCAFRILPRSLQRPVASVGGSFTEKSLGCDGRILASEQRRSWSLLPPGSLRHSDTLFASQEVSEPTLDVFASCFADRPV